ncbi:UDP-glucose 4-epimerase family protein [Terasakiella sp.]|uniref:UDP-glucose 4-epimerase family protein n=1 Tax=Terasakiella sp. TaxID=2034861 RepID=UPI003AA8E20E
MSNILVTGATGFVGQALCQHLLRNGHRVVATYRTHKTDLNCDWLQISDMDGNTDWADKLTGIDVVIHLAARVHMMQEGASDPLATYRAINRDGTLCLAKAAQSQGVTRFVFLSTIKVNGEKTQKDQPFGVVIDQPPVDPYGLSKWEAEEGLRTLAQQTGLEVCILRPPLVYGPGVKANFLSFLKLADKALPVPFKCLHNQRSLVNVENLADALMVCSQHPNAAHKTYLISDGHDLSVADMFALMAQKLKRPCRMIPLPVFVLKILGRITGKSAAIDRLTQSLQVDGQTIQKELNWTPPVSVESGFEKMVSWYKG